MKSLTLEKLNNMQPGEIFASGDAINGEDILVLPYDDGEEIVWQAIRGDVNDWAIYWAIKEEEWRLKRSVASKVHDENSIRKLVNCDDEAFARYRF